MCAGLIEREKTSSNDSNGITEFGDLCKRGDVLFNVIEKVRSRKLSTRTARIPLQVEPGSYLSDRRQATKFSSSNPLLGSASLTALNEDNKTRSG